MAGRNAQAEMLNASEVAKRLGVDDSTVRRWVAEGELPGVRVGGRVLIARRAVDALVEAGGGAALARNFAHTDAGRGAG